MKATHARFARIMTAVLVTTALLVSSRSALAQPSPSQTQCNTSAACLAIGVGAYIYGYPLVMMGLTKQVTTNVANATAASARAPINQFANGTGLPNAAYTDVVLPNVNTLYSLAWLDLSKEPIILHLPQITYRFFLMETLDAWTNVKPHSPGTRSGTQNGNYAFVGPRWKGTLPPGITRVYQMPTNMVWIIGRTYTDGSQADINTIVNTIQPQYTLTPLHAFGKPYSPPTHVPVDPKVDMRTPPFQQVEKMHAGTYFTLLAKLMRSNPPLPADAPLVTQLAGIGLVPGQPFEINQLDPVQRQALEQAVQKGNAIVTAASKHVSLTSTNWSMPLNLGAYGTRYLVRAAIARAGLGANYFADAVYAGANEDSAGQSLNGAHQYTLHFDAGHLPPANPKAFWSVTMYNLPLANLVDNPINRSALGIPKVQDHLPCLGGDGSLTLYIQHKQPDPTTEPTKYCNWLPAPTGGLLLLIRIYRPDQTLFNHQWIPPAVQQVP